MKVRLLKKLRKIGRNQIYIVSTTESCGVMVGMSICMDSSIYSGLFNFGNTEEDVYRKAERIYIKSTIDKIRQKYRRHSAKRRI